MGFWNLVNGQAHNLEPPNPPNLALSPAAVTTAAALGTTLGSVLALAGGAHIYTGLILANRGVWRLAATEAERADEVREVRKVEFAIERIRKGIHFNDSVLKRNPRNTRAWFQNAKAYDELGDCGKALECCEIALQTSDRNVEIISFKGRLLLRKGLFDEAVVAFKRAALLTPGTTDRLIDLGVALVSASRMEEGLECWETALDIDPKLAIAWFNKGTILRALGRPDDALASWKRAYELDYTLTPPWILAQQRGEAGLIKCEFENALAYFNIALGYNPEHAASWLGKGNACEGLRNLAEAMNCWKKAHELEPAHAPPWTLAHKRGEAYLAKGDMVSALACFEAALSVNPDHAPSWYSKGLLHRAGGDPAKAIACFGRATDSDPKHTLAWLAKGNTLADLGSRDAAMKCWIEAFRHDCTAPVPWVKDKDAGIESLGRGAAHEAMLHFNRAIEAYPDYAEAWLRRGVALRALNRMQESASTLDVALRIEPRCHSAWLIKGCIAIDLGNHEEAIHCWDQALAIDNTLAVACLFKGAALADAGMLDEAMEAFEKAKRLGHFRASEAIRYCHIYRDMDPTVGP